MAEREGSKKLKSLYFSGNSGFGFGILLIERIMVLFEGGAVEA